MTKLEKNLLLWIDKHMPLLLAILFTVLGILARVALRDVISGDYKGALSVWFDKIAQNGLYKQIGDYNVAYQLLIWLLTKLHHNSLYLYKISSCIFDFALAITAGIIFNDICYGENLKAQNVKFYSEAKPFDLKKMGGC